MSAFYVPSNIVLNHDTNALCILPLVALLKPDFVLHTLLFNVPSNHQLIVDESWVKSDNLIQIDSRGKPCFFLQLGFLSASLFLSLSLFPLVSFQKLEFSSDYGFFLFHVILIIFPQFSYIFKSIPLFRNTHFKPAMYPKLSTITQHIPIIPSPKN